MGSLQFQEADADVVEDWKVQCITGTCRMSQTIVAADGVLEVLRARVFPGQPATMVLTVPLGIFLKSQVELSVDNGASRTIEFEICNLDGCHAGVPLTPDLLIPLKQGRIGQVTFVDGFDQEIRIEISLSGFTAAFEELSQQ